MPIFGFVGLWHTYMQTITLSTGGTGVFLRTQDVRDPGAFLETLLFREARDLTRILWGSVERPLSALSRITGLPGFTIFSTQSVLDTCCMRLEYSGML